MFIKKTTNWVLATLVVGMISVITVTPSTAVAEAGKQSNTKVIKASGFNWLANGNDVSKREARARQAARRASFLSTRGGAKWICSPAGFGQRSRCHRG